MDSYCGMTAVLQSPLRIERTCSLGHGWIWRMCGHSRYLLNMQILLYGVTYLMSKSILAPWIRGFTHWPREDTECAHLVYVLPSRSWTPWRKLTVDNLVSLLAVWNESMEKWIGFVWKLLEPEGTWCQCSAVYFQASSWNSLFLEI